MGYPAPKIVARDGRRGAAQILWNFEGYGSLRSPSAQQVICDCGSGCGEDCAFKDDGEAGVGFE
jgi:hypothetical protein